MPEKKYKEVPCYGARKGTMVMVKVPEGWCTDKYEIKGDQARAEQYRDFHRCGDIMMGYISRNPKKHTSEIFKLNGVM